jgi:polyferredoxin
MKILPLRRLTQVVAFLLQNPLLGNFFSGKIYQGKAKMFCSPGLNCYSCPAAIVSCPVGAIQLFLAGARHNISYFVSGFLLLTGVSFGRFICGYVCPMGLLQDLIFKIKTPKLRLKLKYLRYLKYLVLLLFVILLPLLVVNELSGLGVPWFCKYICPSGTIFGAIPLLEANDFLREMVGWQFAVKLVIASALIILAAPIYRFFCRTLCPLGAFYSLFNKIAFVKMRCDKEKCVSCGSCREACQIQLNPALQPNSPECVRCGMCRNACEAGALKYGVKNE